MTSDKKTVVVFGGSGFLGSHVADELTRSGYRVKIFDKRHSSYLKQTQEMVIGDIMNQDEVNKAVEGCHIIYNFAGIADIDEARFNPLETANFNVIGTIHSLEAAQQANAIRYIFASSVYVYSNQGSFYKASKQAAEKFIETYKEVYDLDYTILRYGTLYGRRAGLCARQDGHRGTDRRTALYQGSGRGAGEDRRPQTLGADQRRGRLRRRRRRGVRPPRRPGRCHTLRRFPGPGLERPSRLGAE